MRSTFIALGAAMKQIERTTTLAKLFLDPNNPRFTELGVRSSVPLSAVHEVATQARARERILSERFEVDPLKESIAKIGFLRSDRLIAIELDGGVGYMVVEGNRRLA